MRVRSWPELAPHQSSFRVRFGEPAPLRREPCPGFTDTFSYAQIRLRSGRGDCGRCELDRGPGLAPDTARRIACDSSLLRITEDDAGNPLDIGRKSRAIPPALRRALKTRDGGCRFPGCNHERLVDAHHIRHWADGGDTALGNLVLLCRRHHRLVHEGGFGVERSGDNRFRFRRPDGRVIEAHPRLPASGSLAGLRRGNGEIGAVIDASAWIIPGDTLDYGIAIEGLMRKREREPCHCETAC